ncbi:MAG: PqqD family protein [Lachnospiraceae bacterium]|nr:PqqD family protein [Lachnospiraceae bacterium]
MVKNYFDLIPIINMENTWEINEQNVVVIQVQKKGFLNRMAVRFFNRSDKVEIELDGYGSFVWQKINGQKSISEIVEEISKELGEEIELAAKRAAMFFEMLRMHRLIQFLKE